MFKIINISKERWIFVEAADSFYFPDTFVELIKKYQSQISGEIFAVSNDMQYAISNDSLGLVFQWDSCFGITIVVPTETDIEIAEKTISKLCEELNRQKKS